MEQNFEREVLDRLIKIEEKLDGFSKAKEKTYENERHVMILENDVLDLKKEVDSLKESNKWLLRTVAAALITGVIGIIFTMVKPAPEFRKVREHEKTEAEEGGIFKKDSDRSKMGMLVNYRGRVIFHLEGN